MEIIILTIVGLCLGSFINALVWRIRHKRDMWRERSECTHCHHKLAWYDLLPVVSWLSLGGRCRYCRKVIDDNPLVELITPALFLVSYVAWPYGWSAWGWALFGLWMAAVVVMIALTVYDLRWFLLPDRMTFPLMAVGAAIGAVKFGLIEQSGVVAALMTMTGGVVIIAGLYGGLYYISKGKWVGFGDVKLAVFIGLVLGWQGALLGLFIANLAGCLVVLPGLLSGRLTRKSKVPFGPFLIIGCMTAFLWGGTIIEWYLKNAVGL